MFHDVDRYVNFLADHKINQQQYLFLYCLRRKSWDAVNRYKEAFPTDDKTMIGEANKQDLIKRGFIAQVADSGNGDDYIVTDKFEHIFIANKHAALDVFW